MFVSSNAPPVQNGESPMDWSQAVANVINRQALDRAVTRGFRSVLGNCTSPGSYASAGINLMRDISLAPAVSAVVSSNQTASAFSAPSAPDMTDQPVNSIPLSGSAPANIPYSNPLLPPIPSLTTNQGVESPIVPASTRIPPRPRATCPPTSRGRSGNRAVAAPAGLAPNWGNAFAQTQGPSGGTSGLLDWIHNNPLLSFGILVVGAVAVAGGTNGR